MGKEKMVEIYGQEMSFRQMHLNFSQTKEGQRLKENSRYSRYQNGMENEKWETLICRCDLNNLEHNRYTHGITCLFIKDIINSNCEIKINEEEIENLKIAAEIHDWPEGFTEEGDVPFEFKTATNEEKEMAVAKKILTEMFPNKKEKVEEIENIIYDKRSKLGEIFNTIEHIGYMKTAVNAWERRTKMDKNVENNLIWLTENVFGISIPTLIEYEINYPPVKHFLNNKKEIITEAFNKITESNFDVYKPEEREKRKDNFKKAKEKWNNRIE